MPNGSELWSHSMLWRWLLVVTCICTLLTAWLKPWERGVKASITNASYSSAPHFPNQPPNGVQPIKSTLNLPAQTTGIPRDSRFNEIASVNASLFPPDTEMHIVGIYKGAPPPGQTEKPWWSNCNRNSSGDISNLIDCHAKFASVKNSYTVTVDVIRSGHPLVLVLMAYDPVKWNVQIGAGVDVRKIILGGYEGQDIQPLRQNIPVELYTKGSSPCTFCSHQSDYFYAYERNTKDYNNAEQKLYSITGLPPDSFQGSYEANRFTISGSTISASHATASYRQVSEQNYLGKKFSNSVYIEGQMIPLPEGDWVGRVYENKAAGIDPVYFLVLTKSDNRVFQELLAIRLEVSSHHTGFERVSACQMGVGYKELTEKNNSRGSQLCYWIDPVTEPWRYPIFEKVYHQLTDLGIKMPLFVISAGFHRADFSNSLTVIHYKNPTLAGDASEQTNWQHSPWRQDRIQQSPDKEQFLKDYILWVDTWYQLIKASG